MNMPIDRRISCIWARGVLHLGRDSRSGSGQWAAETRGPLAHPPEPGYPCYVSVLGELAWMAPREEPSTILSRDGRERFDRL